MSGPESPLLLLDQNLASSLVRRLADVFPDSAHVRELGLKDDDFRQRSLLRGAPPHVVWVRLGNCRTAEVEALLRARAADVQALVADPDATLLILAHLP